MGNHPGGNPPAAQPGGNQPGNMGNRNPGSNQPGNMGNHPGGNPPAAQPGGNQPGNMGNRNPGGNQPGNMGNHPAGNIQRAHPGGNQPGNMGNRNPGGNNPGGQPAGNQPGNMGNRNPGGNQPGNMGNRNPGGLTPPPGGRVFGANGNQGNRGPVVTRTPNGGMVHRASDGHVREVHTPTGAVIRHEPLGMRHVEVVRPGGRVVVATGRSEGYVQRPVVYGGREFVQRTYIVRGRPEVRVYHPVHFGGLVVNVYRPVRYYPAPMYTWAYSPWVRPVRYSWGWAGRPWYGYYGGWFTPYPVYTSPSLWLTDYLIATTLESAYQARMDAAIANSNAAAYAQNSTPLTPDVKQAISDEVRRELDQSRAEQGNPNGYQPELFGGGGTHVFVVANALEVNSNMGECAVTEGDVLQLNGPPPPNAAAANVVVLASKGMDCRKGSIATVGIADLQEMQNHMRSTIDQGLADLRSKQGQGDIPSLPPAAAAPPVQAPYAAEMRPDPEAVREIPQAAQEAERAEQDVVNQSLAPAEGAGAPVTIALGQTTAEVIATLGQPGKTADLGSKQIYIYKDMKITFTDGRVTDVQ